MASFEPVRFGKYQLIDKIATGGMAEVYKAKSYGVAGFEKLLVIKRILPHLSRNPDFVKMFINEAKIAVSLNHANIVQVYDLGVVGADYYMAMEFIHGQDLMRVCRLGKKKKRFVPIHLGVYIITEVARGLDYAHQLCDPGGRPLHVVHQDVSPHNVLISYEGDVKLVDFGIARVGSLSEEMGGGRIAGGKFAYMAPEQAKGEVVDHRSDIFSAGILLFELATGQRLYRAKNRKEKLQQVCEAEIPRPRDVNPAIPVRLEEILLKTLAMDPAHRYQDARDLQEDLLSFLYDLGLRVSRGDLASCMKDMFDEEYERESSGSVLNAIVRDLQGLGRQPGYGGMTAVEDSVGSVGSQRSVSLGWGADRSGTGGSSLAGTPSLASALSQGERRQVEVLAVEITGLTDIGDKVGEEQVLKLNYSLVKRLASLIRRYRGSITRLDGDRLLAFWGLRKHSSKDLELCLRCADELRELSSRFRADKGVAVHLSMGVHRGAVLVPGGGGRGVRGKRRAYTAWGDTVKLARRLCESAGLDEVLVSERVAGVLNEWCEFESRESIPVKWSAGEVSPQSLLRIRPVSEGAERGSWVARGEECALFEDALAVSRTGQLVVLAVDGEAGSGKGRFLREMRSRVRESNIAFFAGKGTFYRSELPLLPFREILEQISGFSDNDGESEKKERLLGLSELGLDPIDIHLLGQLAELEFADTNLRYLSGDQLRIGTADAIRRVVEGLCDRGPLVLSLQNHEHLDPYSVELVAQLSTACEGKPLLLVLSHSPGIDLGLPESVEVRRLVIPPMGRDECRAFTADLLGARELPDELLELVLQASGGNALFAKEIVLQLRRQGLIAVHDSVASIDGDLGDAEIPATASDLVASRIDELNPAERVILEVAAVRGRAFEQELLSEVTGLVGDELVAVLERLSHLKLLRPARPEEQLGDADFTFRNDLCWEVTLRGVLAPRAREFHNRIGEGIERLHGANLRPYHEVLSEHYEMGGLVRRAAFFAEQAGINYGRQYFNREGLRCFIRAVKLLNSVEVDESEAREVWAHLADLYLRIGGIHAQDIHYKEADMAFTRALDYAGEAEDERLQARALIRVAETRIELGTVDTGGLLLRQAQELADRLGDAELRTDVDEEIVRWSLSQGRLEEAKDVLDEALVRSRERNDAVREARMLDLLGTYCVKTGDLDTSEQHLRAGVEAAQATDDRVLHGRLLNNLGVTYIHMERFEDALTCYRDSCVIREGIEYRRGVIVNLHNMGDVYLRMGRHKEAADHFQQSLEQARSHNWQFGLAMNLVYLGYCRALVEVDAGAGKKPGRKSGKSPRKTKSAGTAAAGEDQLREGIELALEAGARDAAAQGKVFLARLLDARGEDAASAQLREEAESLGNAVLTGLHPPV